MRRACWHTAPSSAAQQTYMLLFLKISDRKHCRKKYLIPLLENGKLKTTISDKPRNPKQKYVKAQNISAGEHRPAGKISIDFACKHLLSRNSISKSSNYLLRINDNLIEYSVHIMQFFQSFCAGRPEIQCNDSGRRCALYNGLMHELIV